MEAVDQLSWLATQEPEITSYFEQLLTLLQTTDSMPGWPDIFGNALRRWVNNALRTPIRTLSLFSGGGGLDIAFHDAGFGITHMIEIDERYVDTLRLNTQEGRRLEGAQPLCIDIKDFDPALDLQIDFIIGGPPCQTFSAAGRRAAGVSGFDDPRGVLFQEYVRLLKKIQPKGFLFENVYGILGAQDGKPWKEIVKAFKDAGYTISYRILDSADYGVPQHRERLIIVGTRNSDFAFPRPTHGPDSPDKRPYYTAGMAIQGVGEINPEPVNGRYGHLLQNIPPGLNYSFYTEKMGHPTPLFSWRSKFSDLLYKADPTMPVRTIKAQGGQYTGPFHWENRRFSIDELKRLQTFPDDYLLAGGKQIAIQQIGNSVPPQFGRILAIAILNQLFGVSFPFAIDYLSPQDKLGFRSRKAALTTYYQQKAREAIAGYFSSGVHSQAHEQQETVENTPLTESFLAYLGPHFTWIIKDDATKDHPWNVECSLFQQEKSIELCVRSVGEHPADPTIEIEVHPSKTWKIPIKLVRLGIQSPSLHLFTAAWKAFEYYLIKEGIKADLVQLNGYYQYKPAIRMKILKFVAYQSEQETAYKWKALQHVLEGVGVRKIISLEQLADLWEMPVDKTIEALVKLRSAGYEIRSSNTNNQIPPRHILIPYAFPTLNPLSVQLRKTLFEISDEEMSITIGKPNE